MRLGILELNNKTPSLSNLCYENISSVSTKKKLYKVFVSHGLTNSTKNNSPSVKFYIEDSLRTMPSEAERTRRREFPFTVK